jgi:hypothetical protein
MGEDVPGMGDATAEEMTMGRRVMPWRPDTWIIVCEDFHGAVGPIPTERLAVGLAAYASEIGGCTYRPVRFALAGQRKDLAEGSA